MTVFLLSLLSLCFFGGGEGGGETVQWLLVIIKRIQSIEVEKLSLMTYEIKCYVCMISCTFIKQIFMVVYTELMYVTLLTV